MLPHLTTERLTIRPITLADAEAVFHYRSDKVTNQYQGFVPETVAEVEALVERNVATPFNQEDSWYQLVMVLQQTHQVIGDIGLHFLSGGNQQVEFGCTLSKEAQGQGYAHEALQEILSYLFTHLHKHRVIASVDPRNTGSINMVERLGMRQEAHFVKSLWFKNEWVDDVVYALLREDYSA